MAGFNGLNRFASARINLIISQRSYDLMHWVNYKVRKYPCSGDISVVAKLRARLRRQG